MSIPSKMRDIIKKKYDPEDLYLILWPGNVLCLFPSVEFEKLTDKLDAAEGVSLEQIMDLERTCANAEFCKLDGSGRIVIPPEMREEAKIKQEVLVIGARNRIEIWDPGRWEYAEEHSRSGLEKLRMWPTHAAQSGVR